MKALVINPNSDVGMTNSIKELVEKFKTDYIEVDVLGMQNTPIFINSQETIDATTDEVVKSIKNNEKEYDIFIIGCHLDPNLDKLREVTDNIVIGIGEASVLYTKILGMRYSIIGSSDKTVKLKTEMVNRYGAQKELDYVGYPSEDAEGSLTEKLNEASKNAIKDYNSDAIVLGCAGFVGIDSYIESKTGKEVIDGVIAALIIADGYAKYKEFKS